MPVRHTHKGEKMIGISKTSSHAPSDIKPNQKSLIEHEKDRRAGKRPKGYNTSGSYLAFGLGERHHQVSFSKDQTLLQQPPLLISALSPSSTLNDNDQKYHKHIHRGSFRSILSSAIPPPIYRLHVPPLCDSQTCHRSVEMESWMELEGDFPTE